MDENEAVAELPPSVAESQELPSEEALQEASTADEIAELRARLDQQAEEARRNQQVLEQRLRDTQAWANQRNMAALAAETAQQVVRANQPRPEAPRPPRFTAEDREEIYTNPERLEQLMEQKIDYGVQYGVQAVLSRIAPDLQAARQAAGLLQPTVEQLATIAVGQAKNMAVQQGFKEEEFDSLLPSTLGFIQQVAGGDEQKINAYAINPKVILYAASQVRQSSGVPVERQAAPPSISTGRPAPRKARAEVLPLPPILADMEKKLGIKYSQESIREFNAKHAAGGRA